MLKSKKARIMLIVVYIFIGAGTLFLCYFVAVNFLAEKSRQAKLDLWESQKQALAEQEITDSSGETAGDSEYSKETNSSYDASSLKEDYTDYEIPAAEDFFPLKMSIPRIDLEWVSYESADSLILEQGPGHIEETPLPGEVGRCTISGHRTTYGSPFERLDELKKRDLIYLETVKGGIFIYAVTGQQIVVPTDIYILEGSGKSELLLTTCHPRYSSAKRLIIIAELLNLYPLGLDAKGGKQ